VNTNLQVTAALVVAASLVACGGMGAQPSATLEPASVTALRLVAVGGESTFCPHGPPVQVQAIASLEGGGSLLTWSDGESREGRLDFTAFEWTASHGQVDGEGRVRLADDPFPLLERPLLVTARVPGKPSIEAKLELRPNWRCGVRVERSGAPGAAGSPGAPGVGGRPGRIGDGAIGATNGELGEPGGPGASGGAGQPAAAVDVALGWVTTSKDGRLVLARVNGRAYLFDPTGARLEVVADGGSGGQGGAGGAGGQGGDGGSSKEKPGTEGAGANGGAGGAGGRGGAGGDGASVRVQHDARDPALAQMIRISNRGGEGGAGGPGGRGGAGGKGGASTIGGRGPDGRTGQRGIGGSKGQAGRPGRAIPSPPAAARVLFADEIARGVPVAVE
jgi:hypothetical protein